MLELFAYAVMGGVILVTAVVIWLFVRLVAAPEP
jgi:uncharacterized membrane protein